MTNTEQLTPGCDGAPKPAPCPHCYGTGKTTFADYLTKTKLVVPNKPFPAA